MDRKKPFVKTRTWHFKKLDFLNNILLQVPKIVNLNVTHFNKDTKYLYQNNKSVLDFKCRMESDTTTTTTTSEKYTYDVKFNGNILIVGRTGCCKATFIQQLGKNKLFGAEITCFLGFKNYFMKWKRRLNKKQFWRSRCSF